MTVRNSFENNGTIKRNKQINKCMYDIGIFKKE